MSSRRQRNIPLCGRYRQVSLYIHIYVCLFYFDALAQGNPYKPAKEAIHYCGSSGD